MWAADPSRSPVPGARGRAASLSPVSPISRSERKQLNSLLQTVPTIKERRANIQLQRHAVTVSTSFYKPLLIRFSCPTKQLFAAGFEMSRNGVAQEVRGAVHFDLSV